MHFPIQNAQGGTITLAKTFVKQMVLSSKASQNLNTIVIWRLASPPLNLAKWAIKKNNKF